MVIFKLFKKNYFDLIIFARSFLYRMLLVKRFFFLKKKAKAKGVCKGMETTLRNKRTDQEARKAS